MALVVKQSRSFLTYQAAQNVHDYHRVVFYVVNLSHFTDQYRGSVVEDRQTVVAEGPVIFGKSKGVVGGHSLCQFKILVAEGVDGNVLGLAKAWPAARA